MTAPILPTASSDTPPPPTCEDAPEPFNVLPTTLPGWPKIAATRYWTGPSANDGFIVGVGSVTNGSWKDGTPGNDVIVGSPSKDTNLNGPNGSDGVDIICGDGGGDSMAGGNGEDVLRSTRRVALDGADCTGSLANAKLDGGAGDDYIVGGKCAETIAGGAGADVIDDKGGNDVISGGDGADQFAGDDGDDTIDGGPGNDGINGGAGSDTICGGSGNDQIVGDHPRRGPNGNDSIDTGGGQCKNDEDQIAGTWNPSLGTDTDTCGTKTDIEDGFPNQPTPPSGGTCEVDETG